MILYLGYVVSIGGDFMAGRFLALPAFASVLLMTRFVAASKPLWGTAAGILLIVGCSATHVPLWSNSRNVDASPKPSGIVDERAVYFHDRSLTLAKRGTFRDPDWPSSPWHGTGRNVVDACGLMGAGGIVRSVRASP